MARVGEAWLQLKRTKQPGSRLILRFKNLRCHLRNQAEPEIMKPIDLVSLTSSWSISTILMYNSVSKLAMMISNQTSSKNSLPSTENSSLLLLRRICRSSTNSSWKSKRRRRGIILMNSSRITTRLTNGMQAQGWALTGAEIMECCRILHRRRAALPRNRRTTCSLKIYLML